MFSDLGFLFENFNLLNSEEFERKIMEISLVLLVFFTGYSGGAIRKSYYQVDSINYLLSGKN